MMFFRKILLLFFVICFVQVSSASAPVKITKVRSSTDHLKTRLVFDATNAIHYTVNEKPGMIVVGVKNASFAAVVTKKILAGTPIKSITSIRFDNNLQITITLKDSFTAKIRHFMLTKPWRLVFDLDAIKIVPSVKVQAPLVQEQAKKDEEIVYKPAKVVAGKSVENIAPVATKKPIFVEEESVDVENKSQRDVVIVIDPGHGGKDPGATGAHGTLEKNVALAIATNLKNLINQTKGFHAILTRNGDYFITLRERLDIAHKSKADMFVAIHADAYKDPDAHGASVFALSQRGATSEAARWLAEKENESELGQAMSDKSDLLRSVLIDLAQTATISSSLEVGATILNKLAQIAKLHMSHVEQAAFVVLKSPDIPSLLVETGFLSDIHEEMKLRDVGYQQKIAIYLADGITSYFARKPPQGTYLASAKQKTKAKYLTLVDSLPGGSA